MLPGFYAAHDPFPDSGLNELSKVDLNGPPIGAIRTMDELIAALKRKAEAIPAGGWVVSWGYDDTLLAEAPHPTRTDLGRVSNAAPGLDRAYLGASRRGQFAGVTKATEPPRGGRIRLDPQTGEPKGAFEEAGTCAW